jgi:hypothetical protein
MGHALPPEFGKGIGVFILSLGIDLYPDFGKGIGDYIPGMVYRIREMNLINIELIISRGWVFP